MIVTSSWNIRGSSGRTFLWLLAVTAVAVLATGGTFWHGETAARDDISDTGADVTVYKTKYCGCCHKWVEHLRDSGLTVALKDVDSTRPVRSKLGVPDAMASCHTAVAGDYWVEGHVPADLIQRLLEDQPADIKGIAVPGMPVGSPGMEGANPVTYDVVALGMDGNTNTHATREGMTSPRW